MPDLPKYDSLKRAERRNRSRGFKNQAAVDFHARNDWDALRDEFFEAVDQAGEYGWKTLGDLIRAKFTDPSEQGLAWHVLGRKPAGWIPWEGDWEHERRLEYYGRDKRIQAIAEKIEQEATAAQVLTQTAPLNIEMIGRCMDYSRQLDRETNGQLMEPGKPFEENAKRARIILNILKAISDIIAQQTGLLMGSLGGQQVVAMQTIQRVLEQPPSESPEDLRKQAWAHLIKVSFEKAKLYGMDPPQLMEGQDPSIVEAPPKDAVKR